MGCGNVFVVGDVDGCELFLVFFEDDGLSVFDIVINFKEDIVVLLFLSGIIGYFKGVILMYYNLILCGSIMCFKGFFSFDEIMVFLVFFLFFYSYGMVVIMLMGFYCGSIIIIMLWFEWEKFFYVF